VTSGPDRTPSKAPPSAPAWADWLRPRWLRLSRFERNIASALVLATVVPLLGALWLAAGLAEQDLTLGLSPRVVDRLAAVPGIYGELFQARKQLFAEQARGISRGLPQEPAAARRHLASAVARTPGLRRAPSRPGAAAPAASADGTAGAPWRARKA